MKSNKYLVFLSLLIAFLAFGSCRQKPKEQNISISGAFALYPLTVKWAEEYQKLHPDIVIDISAGGAGKGMTDVLSGMVDLAMFSRSVAPQEVTNGAWSIAVARDAVVPTVSSSNPCIDKLVQHGLTKSQFTEIYSGRKITGWQQLFPLAKAEKINIYTRSDACGAGEMWAKFLGTDQELLAGTGVFGDPGIADAVKNDKWGIGYNNVVYTYDTKSRKPYPGIQAIPIDLNSNGTIDKYEEFYGCLDSIMLAIADGRYPSPPARDLYLISKGKPSKKTATDFINWILTDGQMYIREAGYVQLKAETVEKEKNKLSK